MVQKIGMASTGSHTEAVKKDHGKAETIKKERPWGKKDHGKTETIKKAIKTVTREARRKKDYLKTEIVKEDIKKTMRKKDHGRTTETPGKTTEKAMSMKHHGTTKDIRKATKKDI